MEKIIKLALEAKFPNVDLTNLMDVLNATGNVVVATEMLLNIYEEPNIPKSALVCKTPANFISFNKYKREVRYSTDNFITKSLYFDSEEAANQCIEYDTSIGRNYRKDGDVEKEFKIPSQSFGNINLVDWIEGSRRIDIKPEE